MKERYIRTFGNRYEVPSPRGSALMQILSDSCRKHGLDADACEHACGNRDGGAEAGHAFQETAEAPADEQDEHALVMAHGGQHFFDDVHALGMQGEIVGEDGCDDDQKNRPACQRDAFCDSHRRVDGRHVEVRDEHARKNGDRESDGAGFPGAHLEKAQCNYQPQDRRERNQK